MSYDLMVFDPESAPRNPSEFLEWYKFQTTWAESHGYDDPIVSTAKLKAWYFDIIKIFPPMNGIYSSEKLPEDESLITDYSVGKTVIYAAFAWSKTTDAYEATFNYAEKHQVGFFDVSFSNGEVWLPDDNGKLVMIQRKKMSIFSKYI